MIVVTFAMIRSDGKEKPIALGIGTLLNFERNRPISYFKLN